MRSHCLVLLLCGIFLVCQAVTSRADFVVYSDAENHFDKRWVEAEGAMCDSLDSFGTPEGSKALYVYSTFIKHEDQSPVVTEGRSAGCGSFFQNSAPLDLSAYADGELRFLMSVNATSFGGFISSAFIKIEIEDSHGSKAAVYTGMNIWYLGEWVEFRFPFKSFSPAGIDFSSMRSPFMVTLLNSYSSSESSDVPNEPKLLVDHVRLVDTNGVYTLFSDSVLSWQPNYDHTLAFHSRESMAYWPAFPACTVDKEDETAPEGTSTFVAPRGVFGCGFEYDSGVLDLSKFTTLKFWLQSVTRVKIEYQSDTYLNPNALKAEIILPSTNGVWTEITLNLDDFTNAFIRDRISRPFMITKLGEGGNLLDARFDNIRFL